MRREARGERRNQLLSDRFLIYRFLAPGPSFELMAFDRVHVRLRGKGRVVERGAVEARGEATLLDA
jgi:hypothetical protein